MRYLTDISSFIGHYGLSNFLYMSLKKLLRKISLLKFSYLIKSGKINSPNFIFPNIDKITSIIMVRKPLRFEQNIESIKQGNYYPAQVRQILSEADHFCNNTFNILNSGWIKWEHEGNIDWHSDKKSNYRFNPETYYTVLSTEIRNLVRSGEKSEPDLKVPRELSRFHFLFGLYFAYIYSNDQRFLDKIKDSIVNWIEMNPPYYGINWSNAMEAAIRISNWTLIVFALKDVLLKDHSFAQRFYTSLYQHNLYIQFNMENLILINNHYLSDIVGLFVSNLFFPVFKVSDKWLRNSSRKIKRELVNQINEDGGDFESSTPYQRLVTELVFLPMFLSRHFQTIYFDPVDEAVLKDMFNLVLHTLKPSANIIQFGDNDDGRMFKLHDRSSLDHRYLLSLSFGLFQDRDFCIIEMPFDILAYLFYGKEAYRSYLENQRSIYTLPSTQFRESGIYILRSDQIYLAVSCMPNGQSGYGVHTHNDKLSFELTLRDIDIIVDPGTYLYSSNPEARNIYRSTKFHNTVMENMKEQNDFGEDVFRLKNEAEVQVCESTQSKLKCRHNGFLKKGGSTHQREFQLDGNQVSIIDSLDKNLPSQSFLHFGYQIMLQNENGSIHILKEDRPICHLEIQNADDIQIEDYYYSPGYALRIPCLKLIIDFKNKLIMKFINLN